MRIIPFVAAATAALSGVVGAQRSSDTFSLQGRSAFSLGIGLTGARTETTALGSVSEHTTGQVGSLAFTHWVRPTVAVEISASVLDADQTVSGAQVHDNAVVPILFGLSVSPRALALSQSIRPYVSLAAGPYVHAVSDVQGPATSSSTETALGARFAVGANWFVARHFLLGVDGNYHAVGKFDHPDALTRDPSAFGMSISFGFAWGGR